MTAKFNAIQLLLIRSSIVPGSMSYDAKGDAPGNVFAAITPDVAPGSMILYRPIHPSRIAQVFGEQLKESHTTSIRFILTDNDNQPVTISEAYTFRLILVVIPHSPMWENVCFKQTHTTMTPALI